MTEPKHIEWMNMEIDGLLPPDETSELHKYLTSDPEAAKYYDSLKATVSAVDAAGDPGPPPYLEQRILSEGPWNRRISTSAAGGPMAQLTRWFSTPALRYAAVFCFGIVTGLLFLYAINFGGGNIGGELENSFLAGTMRQITAVEGLKQTQDHKVDLEQARGQVSLYESKNILLTEVILDVPEKIEWTLQYDENDVVFEGYRRFENETSDINVTRSGMRVSQTGDARYLFFFTRKDPQVDPMVIKLFSANQLLLEKTLVPSAAE
jgi:hypothetical protein